jgi:hypothetical protein
MAEWWNAGLGELSTYRPSDFLMFSPRTYWRLFELHNHAWWPAPLALPALGLAAWAWLRRGGVVAQRAMALGLAAASVFVALAFVMERYEAINWAARGLAWLMAAQALALLGVFGTLDAGAAAAHPMRRKAALGLAAWALVAHPLLAVAMGRPWAQAEVFGLAPDPTTLAVLAWLVQAPTGGGTLARWALRATWAMAGLLCAASAATLATMDEPQAALMAGLPAMAWALAWATDRSTRRPVR